MTVGLTAGTPSNLPDGLRDSVGNHIHLPLPYGCPGTLQALCLFLGSLDGVDGLPVSQHLQKNLLRKTSIRYYGCTLSHR